jgi:electron transfer flavoprotein beta subunit
VRILVAVKQVAKLAEDVIFDGPARVSAEAVSWGLNEWDRFSLEAAVRLAEGCEQSAGAEVIAVTVGDERAEQGLRACLAGGAHRAIRLWDAQLEDADPLAVATVLAAVAREQQPDLILCGAQSSDAAYAATGVALAGLLDLTRVAVVGAIERDGERLTAERELDGGALEVLRLSLPALLTIQTGINEPRHATLREIKQARGRPVATRGLAELGLDGDALRAAAGSRTLRLLAPETGGALMLAGAPSAIAERIAEIVNARVGA